MNAIFKQFSTFLEKTSSVLPRSLRTDILLFLLGIKKCVRTISTAPYDTLAPLQTWTDQNAFHLIIDQENFIYISRDQELAHHVSQVDRSSEPHEVNLGLLLGYPLCCCKKIAEIGEMHIDEYEDWLTKQPFYGKFQLINPLGYREGSAFISHVPCSTRCIDSLNHSLVLANFVFLYRNEIHLWPWLNKLEKIEYLPLIQPAEKHANHL